MLAADRAQWLNIEMTWVKLSICLSQYDVKKALQLLHFRSGSGWHTESYGDLRGEHFGTEPHECAGTLK